MYTDAIEQLRSEAFFGAVTLWHNGGQATTYANLKVTNDATNEIVTPLEVELDDAYTRWQAAQAIRDSDEEAQRLTKEDVKQLLALELVKDTPDTAGAYAALQLVIAGNAKLTNAHQNTADLFGFDTNTQGGFLRAAYLLIALMS